MVVFCHYNAFLGHIFFWIGIWSFLLEKSFYSFLITLHDVLQPPSVLHIGVNIAMRKPKRVWYFWWEVCNLWQGWQLRYWKIVFLLQCRVVSKVHSLELTWWQASMKTD